MQDKVFLFEEAFRELSQRTDYKLYSDEFADSILPGGKGLIKKTARFDEVTEAISAKESQSERLDTFIKRIKAQTEPVADFDSQLWTSMVECVTVAPDKGLTVVFRDGAEM